MNTYMRYYTGVEALRSCNNPSICRWQSRTREMPKAFDLCDSAVSLQYQKNEMKVCADMNMESQYAILEICLNIVPQKHSVKSSKSNSHLFHFTSFSKYSVQTKLHPATKRKKNKLHSNITQQSVMKR